MNGDSKFWNKKELFVEKVEASIGSLILVHGSGDLVETAYPLARVVHGRNELQVAVVSRGKNALKRAQAVDALLHGRLGHGSASIVMFYLTVVLEKGDLKGNMGRSSQDRRTRHSCSDAASLC